MCWCAVKQLLTHSLQKNSTGYKTKQNTEEYIMILTKKRQEPHVSLNWLDASQIWVNGDLWGRTGLCRPIIIWLYVREVSSLGVVFLMRDWYTILRLWVVGKLGDYPCFGCCSCNKIFCSFPRTELLGQFGRCCFFSFGVPWMYLALAFP